MKVAVVGYGIDGKVSAQYWADKGDEVTVCDAKTDLAIPNQFQTRLGKEYLNNLHDFDLIVRTSGIHPRVLIGANPAHPEIAGRITSGLAEFLAVCPSSKILGVTGTKGKGTTSTLAAKILEAAGKKVHLGGNIGIAVLEMLPKIQPDDFVVLELSSFQLIDLKQRIPTAVCLMIAPEHLNWHADLDEYYQAKAQLFAHQAPEDLAIYNANNRYSKEIASSGPARKLAYDVPAPGEAPKIKEGAYVENDTVYYQGTSIMPIADVALIGRHNLENVCAAIMAVWPAIDGDLEAIKHVVSAFKGLAHHMEYVTTLDGVIFYNDSYSTMPDASIAALAALSQPKVLILGGGSKGLDLDDMITSVVDPKSRVRHVVIMGSLAGQLKAMLTQAGYTNFTQSANDMTSIVAESRKFAQPGDVVLLSPGLPAKGDGFYIDNVDRGNQFKTELAKLAG